MGKLAAKAGLADLDFKDEELVRGFEAIAARFREMAPETELSKARKRLNRDRQTGREG